MRSAKAILLYAGTYNLSPDKQEEHPGIYVFRFDPDAGGISPAGELSNAANPSFLCLSPDARFLYAPKEVPEVAEKGGGCVAAFSINDRTGIPSPLNSRCTGGGLPCHVALDRRGKWLFAANYKDGSFAVFPIRANGSLGNRSAFVRHSSSGKDPKRQEGAHTHSCIMDPTNRLLMVADLGLDRVAVYELDSERGSVRSLPELWIATRPGAGPRHMTFHPNGRFFYVVNELDSTVSAFLYQSATGRIVEIHTVEMLPSDFTGFSKAADIHIHPNGRFLYASNRGHDSIAIYSIDANTGMLSFIGRSPTLGGEPRNFALAPGGDFLLAANEKGNNIVVFRLDSATGCLSPTGEHARVPSPTCLLFRQSVPNSG